MLLARCRKDAVQEGHNSDALIAAAVASAANGNPRWAKI
jgi:hypothetical protein